MDRWLASGGGTRWPWWMQLKADLTGIPVEVPAGSETGTLGAALLAGTGTGVYRSLSEAVSAAVPIALRYEPDLVRGARYADRLAEHEASVGHRATRS